MDLKEQEYQFKSEQLRTLRSQFVNGRYKLTPQELNIISTEAMMCRAQLEDLRKQLTPMQLNNMDSMVMKRYLISRKYQEG